MQKGAIAGSFEGAMESNIDWYRHEETWLWTATTLEKARAIVNLLWGLKTHVQGRQCKVKQQADGAD
jgi:hypothetical protein